MPELTLVFAPPRPVPSSSWSSDLIHPKYSLLTLPPTLLSLFSDPSTSHTLEIRGHQTDPAVLTSSHPSTNGATYSLRGVQNSNSLLLCSSGFGTRYGEEEGEREEGSVVISETLHETLECVACVGRTERLGELMRGSEYEGEEAEQEDEEIGEGYTYLHPSDLASYLPATDQTIALALITHRIITLNSKLRKIPLSLLLNILPALLESLDSEKLTGALNLKDQEEREEEDRKEEASKLKGKRKASVLVEESKPFLPAQDTLSDDPTISTSLEELLATLDSVDCCEAVGRSILEWYGLPGKNEGEWDVKLRKVVREIGVALLAEGGYVSQSLPKFQTRWEGLCGKFSYLCDVSLLSSTSLTTTIYHPHTIIYLPLTRLSADPATRFNELFTLKPRWLEIDMIRFLDDLVGGEKKKRDALVLKFVRKVGGTGGEEKAWTARNLW